MSNYKFCMDILLYMYTVEMIGVFFQVGCKYYCDTELSRAFYARKNVTHYDAMLRVHEMQGRYVAKQ